MLQVNANKNKNPLANGRKGLDFRMWMMFQELMRKVARYSAQTSQGTLSMPLIPANGETIIIGTKTYTWQTVLTNVDGNILIGATLALSQQNLIDAINLTGTPGGQYAQSMQEHPQVSAATIWVTNNLIITAKTAGAAGNTIATTETMAGAGNQFDAATLGTTRLGSDETDADTTLFSTNLSNLSNSNVADVADAQWFNLNDYNPQGMAGWINSTFPYTPDLIAATGSRKIVAPNHFDRKYVNLRSFEVGFYTQKNNRVTLAAPFVVGSNAIIKSIALDSTRAAIMFRQNNATAGTYLVIASSDANGLLTFGVPVLIDANQDDNAPDMCLVNTDKILISFMNSLATNFVATRTATISVTAITMNALVQVAATATDFTHVVKVGTDKAILAWRSGTIHTYNVVTITGTVPSYGTGQTITGTPQYLKLVANGTDKAQGFYFKSSQAYTVTISSSGTTISFGNELPMLYMAIDSRYNHDAIQVATDKFIWLGGQGYDMANNGDRRNAAFITVTSTTSAASSYAATGVDNTSDTMRLIQVTAGTDYYFLYSNGVSMKGKKLVIDTTANTITVPYGEPWYENRLQDGNIYGFWFPRMHSYQDNYYGLAGRNSIVQVGTKVFCFGLGLGNFFHYYASDQISLQLYNNENLVGTFAYNYPFLSEPKYPNVAINDYQANLRLKNTGATPIYAKVYRTFFEME